jgi:EAL domain-containing protein (putative c-di-GMP-specific phosphodiesterase class I)
MELALREAVGRRDIAVHYQGQVDLRTGALVGAEALSRWHHPALGAVSPLRFFSLAEETGLAVELGAQVMAAACQEVSSWPRQMRIAINVSPSQFELDDVPARVSRCLEKNGLDPRRLDLEITEGMLLAATPNVLHALERIRHMGVGIAIDDFGTGYSSLAYLGTLPVDKVKIDQSFIRKLMVDPRADAIVEAMLALCRRLGLSVVAEGIETDEQAEWLRARQCEFGQGYLFHRAVAGAEMRAVIAGEAQKRAAALA